MQTTKNAAVLKGCIMEEKQLIPAEIQREECYSGRKDTTPYFSDKQIAVFGRVNVFSDGKLDNNSTAHSWKGLHSSAIAEYLLSNSRPKYKRIDKCKNKQCMFS